MPAFLIDDIRTRRTSALIGHRAGLSNCLYNFDHTLIASSSMDKSAKVWDARTNSCVTTLLGHDDEVLDLAFDNSGRKLATASGDATARVWDVNSDFQQLAIMQGHKEEVSKGKFLPLLSRQMRTIGFSLRTILAYASYVYHVFTCYSFYFYKSVRVLFNIY